MPNIIHGDIIVQDLTRVRYDYDYPGGLDLKPGSELHKHIKSEILRRARASHNKMSKRFASWNEIDQLLTAYIAPDEAEEKVKEEDKRKPVSIVFPYSYAIMETLLTYLVMAFFQDPIFRYEGVSPEDVIGAILLEKTIELHCNKMKVPLNLHTMFRDGLGYGMGVGAPIWKVKRGDKTITEMGGFFSTLYNKFMETGPKKGTLKNEILFEGNALDNVDPYLYLPDPNVAVSDVQKGEYCGWVSKDNRMNLLKEEKNANGDVFNAKYLKHIQAKKSQFAGDKSDREKKFGPSKEKDEAVVNPIDVIYMYVDLIPKDWKIGSGEYPEKWLFGLANDSVIIKAKPLGLDHNMFPVAVCAPEADGYSPTPISKLEVLGGLQGVLDWLFNSHIANVRKAINDMLVVDPFLVNIRDLKDPGPGKLVRMRRPAWGKAKVQDAVHQLVVKDITQANIADSQWIVQWMQKVAGADDPMMGSLRKGGPERLTGREFQGTRVGAVSRLERVAKIIGLQAMQDIGYMFAVHAQQMMKKDAWVKATGRWQEDLINEYGTRIKRGRIKVSPTDIVVEHDVFVRDGSIPGSNFSELWVQMFKVLVETEGLGGAFDVVRIFKHIARGLGAKNVGDFVKIAPDEKVLREGEKGNLVPLGEA